MPSDCFLKNLLNKSSFGVLALIDPDYKNDDKLDKILSLINNNKFLAILVGGSSIADNLFKERLSYIRDNTSKPIILFPGSSEQICSNADAILFTSLLSGRNPKYLISEQLKGVKSIKKYKLKVVPTGYLLISSNKKTAVERISKTKSLNPKDFENILNHTLVAQYFGMRYIYLENGSGADCSIQPKLIKFLKDNIDIPIIIGGGIKDKQQVQEFKEAGASFVVIGTLIEKNENKIITSFFN